MPHRDFTQVRRAGAWKRATALLAILSTTAASAQTTYHYDELGRLSRVTDTDNSVEYTYVYDHLGNRTSTTTLYTNQNQPPVFTADATAVVYEYQAGTFYPLSNDYDPDSDPISAVNIVDPTGVTISYNPTTKAFNITGWTPGLYTVTYDLSDGNGGITGAHLTVDVQPDLPCDPYCP